MKKLFTFAIAAAALLFGAEVSAQNITSDVTKDGIRTVQALADEVVCATNIEVQAKGDVIVAVKFTRGCSGNQTGIAHLIEGMKIDEAIKRLDAIPCGKRQIDGAPTSCPDQLARVLKMMAGQAPYRSMTADEVKAYEEERAAKAAARRAQRAR